MQVRVCFVSRHYWPVLSAMSAYAENLLRELVRAGHEVTLVAQYRGDRGGTPDPSRVPAGVEMVALEATGEQAVLRGEPADFERDIDAMVGAISELHERRPFDLLHAQYAYPTGLAALRAAHTLDLPAVVTVQGDDGRLIGGCCPTHHELMRAVIMNASAVLIGSPSFAAEVVERLGVDPARFSLVPGATDPERFAPRALTEMARISAPPILLYHGALEVRKGVLDVLDAVALLVGDGLAVTLLVSGDGSAAGIVAERVRELDLDKHVEQLGPVDYGRAHEVYRRAEIFVSPTYAAGFPTTVLEAMAGGLPVISTDVVGVRDCIRPEDNGVLVPPGDPFALAAAIRRLVVDDVLRRRIAERAYSDVHLRWSWPVVGGKILAIYESMTAGVPEIADPPIDPACPFREKGLP